MLYSSSNIGRDDSSYVPSNQQDENTNEKLTYLTLDTRTIKILTTEDEERKHEQSGVLGSSSTSTDIHARVPALVSLLHTKYGGGWFIFNRVAVIIYPFILISHGIYRFGLM